MPRATLIHWKPEETGPLLAGLKAAGYDASLPRLASGADLKTLVSAPPDVFVIDLSRLPSHGREVALALRARKSTRHIPLVFLEGDVEKVARIKSLLPDAVYSTWRSLKSALRTAVKNQPASPIVPGNNMAGYSGTPLPKKLGIKAGSVVALIEAPEGFLEKLDPLPQNAGILTSLSAPADLIVLFCDSRRALQSNFRKAALTLEPKGRLWIAWPKKTSALASDLDQNFVRAYGLDQSFVDFKICAIDDTWSGLCFVRRAGK